MTPFTAAWAFGSIDREYGHQRRYDAASFARLAERACPGARLETHYFNLPGLGGWFLIGKVFRRRTISPLAIRALELLCPLLRPLDALLHRGLRIPLGQSLIAVVTLP